MRDNSTPSGISFFCMLELISPSLNAIVVAEALSISYHCRLLRYQLKVFSASCHWDATKELGFFFERGMVFSAM